MDKNLHDAVRSLNVSFAVDSYPVLKNLRYFRDYNSYVENSLKVSMSEADDNLGSKSSQSQSINLKYIEYLYDVQKYHAFGNLMRISLLTAICAFLENVITTPCVENSRKERYNIYFRKIKSSNRKDKSTVRIAKDFLHSEGYIEINNIDGWSYVRDMMSIRNCFVHRDGNATSYVQSISKKYDFFVVEGKIVLGELFLDNYITLLERFSIEFAKTVYSDQSSISRLFKDKMNIEFKK